jgi:hypothetical protein
MIGGITPPAFPAGYIPPEIITGDTDRLIIGSDFFSEFEFPSGTRISLRQEKNMVITNVVGMKGSVKELTGFDDWNITIEFNIYASVYGAGLLSAPENPLVKTMIQKLKEIKKLWEEVETLYLTHFMLNSLGIKNVVMKSLQIPDAPYQYKQNIIMVVLSDEEYDLDSDTLEKKASAVEDDL